MKLFNKNNFLGRHVNAIKIFFGALLLIFIMFFFNLYMSLSTKYIDLNDDFFELQGKFYQFQENVMEVIDIVNKKTGINIELKTEEIHTLKRPEDFTQVSNEFNMVQNIKEKQTVVGNKFIFESEKKNKFQNEFNRVLIKVSRFLKDIGVGFFFCRGMALGAAREQYFIEHEDDIDLCVLEDSTDIKYLTKKVEESKDWSIFQTFGDGSKENGYEFQIVPSKNLILPDIINNIRVDIFFMFSEYTDEIDESSSNDKRGIVSQKIKKYYVILYYCTGFWESFYKPLGDTRCKVSHDAFNFKRIEFLGNYYWVPDPLERYLVECYGEDWQTPKDYSYWEGVSGAFKVDN